MNFNIFPTVIDIFRFQFHPQITLSDVKILFEKCVKSSEKISVYEKLFVIEFYFYFSTSRFILSTYIHNYN